MRPRNRWTAGLALGAALGAAAIVAVDAGTGPADAQSKFSVSAEQLQINQKISQAAVERSNMSLNYLAPIRTSATDAADDGSNGVKKGTGAGWTSSQIADGAVTREKVAGGLLPYWAVVDSTGTLVRSQGATAVTKTGVGTYQITWTPNVSQCAYQATVASPSTPPPAPANGQVSVYAPSNNVTEVQTFGAVGVAADRAMHVTIAC